MSIRREFYEQAFTLVELALVLVIIGLLVGGVLVGKDLIDATKLNKAQKIVTSLNAATLTFRTKYNCIPGDCLKATSYGFAANGNGDDKVYTSGNMGGENFQYFQMLITAGLLNDSRVCTLSGIGCAADWPLQKMGLTIPFDTIKRNGITPAIGIINADSVNAVNVNGYTIPFSNAYAFNDTAHKAYANIPTLRAWQLDRKFDDTVPLTGDIVMMYPQDETEIAPDNRYYADANTCMDRTTTPFSYQGPATRIACTMIWKTGF